MNARLPAWCMVLLLGACSASNTMRMHVPASCHGATAPFESFAIEQVDVPGFMEPLLADALTGALLGVGLRAPAGGRHADVTMRARYLQVTRGLQGPDGAAGAVDDGFGDAVAAGAVMRFVAHLDFDLIDNRDGALIWRATLDRPHAITGGETFHDDRARLLLATTLDRMLRGVTEPCAA